MLVAADRLVLLVSMTCHILCHSTRISVDGVQVERS